MRQLTFDDIYESLQQAAAKLQEADQAQAEIDEQTEAELASKASEPSTALTQLNTIYNRAMQDGNYDVALRAISTKLSYNL